MKCERGERAWYEVFMIGRTLLLLDVDSCCLWEEWKWKAKNTEKMFVFHYSTATLIWQRMRKKTNRNQTYFHDNLSSCKRRIACRVLWTWQKHRKDCKKHEEWKNQYQGWRVQLFLVCWWSLQLVSMSSWRIIIRRLRSRLSIYGHHRLWRECERKEDCAIL